MSVFRFRAAAVLEARRKQEDHAAALLATEEARLRASEARLAASVSARKDAGTALVAAEQDGATRAASEWHRNWISGLAVTIARQGQEVQARGTDVRRAEQAWYDARRRRLMLERLRERALERFRLAEHRRALKDMDELARLRYCRRAQRSEGTHP